MQTGHSRNERERPEQTAHGCASNLRTEHDHSFLVWIDRGGRGVGHGPHIAKNTLLGRVMFLCAILTGVGDGIYSRLDH